MKRPLTVLAAAALVLALPAVALAQEAFAATLSGAQEVPAVSTSASGSVSVTLSADETTITFEVTYSGLSGDLVAAHIHLPGAAGTVAAPVLPLISGTGPASGSLSGTLTSADLLVADVSFAAALDAIRDGNAYANLHTAANPGGEIRGQLASLPPTSTTDPAAPGSLSLLALALVFVVSAAALGVFVRRPAR